MSDVKTFFAAKIFQIHQPLAEWHMNYRLTNEEGAEIFARSRNRTPETLLAWAFVAATVYLAYWWATQNIEIAGTDPVWRGLFIGAACIFTFAVSGYIFNPRYLLRFYADAERKRLVFKVKGSFWAVLQLSFNVRDESGFVGAIDRKGLLKEEWRLWDRGGNCLATGRFTTDERFSLTEIKNDHLLATLTRTFDGPGDNYQLQWSGTPPADPRLALALALILDDAHYAVTDRARNWIFKNRRT